MMNDAFEGAKKAGFDFWFIELNGMGILFHRAYLSDREEKHLSHSPIRTRAMCMNAAREM
jgi:hypothetical protein